MLFPYILSVIVAVLKIQVSFSVVSFEASSNYVKKGSPFTLTCHASPLTGIVQFLKNGSIVGSCSAPLVGVRPGTCIPVDIVQVLASENTTWTILSASFSANNGTWECVHGTETSKTFVMITELAKDITINDASLPAEPTLNTEYNASVDCSYPTPNIKWTLQECTGTSNNNIDVNVNPRVIEDPSSCTYPAQKYFSAIKVSDMATPGKDPKCYMPWATLYYSFDSSASVPKKSNVSFSLPGTGCTCKCDCDEMLIFLILLIDVILLIVLLYNMIKKIKKMDKDQVDKMLKKCCGHQHFLHEYLVMLIIIVIQAIIVIIIIIVKCECPGGLVAGIGVLLFVVCPLVYFGIFWVGIVVFSHCSWAEMKIGSEITKESPRESINGDAGLSSPVTPGRKLPPLPPLTRTDPPPWIQTDPDKLVNTEKKKKKKKKKTKTEVNEENQAETNKSEINDQVDAENLPETNKTSD